MTDDQIRKYHKLIAKVEKLEKENVALLEWKKKAVAMIEAASLHARIGQCPGADEVSAEAKS